VKKTQTPLKTGTISSTPVGYVVPTPLVAQFCYSCFKPGEAVICFKLFIMKDYCVLSTILL